MTFCSLVRFISDATPLPTNVIPLLTQTWRPRDAPVCAEVYSTGRVNVPGGKRHRDLLVGFARLVPELLRFSSTGAIDDDDPGPGAMDVADDESLDVGNTNAAARGGEAPADDVLRTDSENGGGPSDDDEYDHDADVMCHQQAAQLGLW